MQHAGWGDWSQGERGAEAAALRLTWQEGKHLSHQGGAPWEDFLEEMVQHP